ncbi:stage II sporulation protein P [Radiobacillus deserti]|uniref:Stage II sporulation protein P n=1 Tax=Radiobacillus deserti TaxID=2594883 RepID=A0A516KJJ3_9BACI|nr:stage II sporulation protein P [Radiobacillus deserti]QDP41570.1 stage II sporulation protein P [Radiobacillus deserti]
MSNDKDLFDLIKDTYPQHPSHDFISSTEYKLKQKARSMKRRRMVKKLTLFSGGFFLCTVAVSWLFIFGGKELVTEVLNALGEESLSTSFDNKEPLIYIYHSHNTESFLPELNVENPSKAQHDKKNITLVGQRLKQALKDKNIKSIHNTTDVNKLLDERGWSFYRSYEISREKLKDDLDKNKSIKMVLDIHRDVTKKDVTTIKLEGVSYAKVLFVVSGSTSNFEENKDFATKLHNKLQEKYPGISRGVIEKQGKSQSTYNQDLLDNSVILIIGGVENTLKEENRTADVLAEIIKEVLDSNGNS